MDNVLFFTLGGIIGFLLCKAIDSPHPELKTTRQRMPKRKCKACNDDAVTGSDHCEQHWWYEPKKA